MLCMRAHRYVADEHAGTLVLPLVERPAGLRRAASLRLRTPVGGRPRRGAGTLAAVEHDTPGALLQLLQLLVAEVELEGREAGRELLGWAVLGQRGELLGLHAVSAAVWLLSSYIDAQQLNPGRVVMALKAA